MKERERLPERTRDKKDSMEKESRRKEKEWSRRAERDSRGIEKKKERREKAQLSSLFVCHLRP